ncbi:Clan CA, family C19, ubiquitin hydrolase-like cysteine peptidase [Histomonas meleagridis]|uniref:Clan CA, family C19, ubiquitin hydrolase-like cysteine peptidase n=1 Tax=Histomonas meleagridis TaxID=135588 RepID=UPI00355A30A3|nr:Clan CA, family C19, ubiquitin hydrolase-like cysteine peptidase [Histomonas meleagridis]
MNKTFRWTLDDYETKIGKKVSYSFEYSQYQITLTARLEKSDYKPFHIKATIDRDSENWKTRIKFKIINKENALETKKKKATFTNQEKKSKIIFDVPSSYFLHTSGYLNDGALEIDLTFEDEYSSDDDPFGSNIDPYDDIVYQSPNTTYSSNTTYWNTTYYKSQKNNSKEETGYVGLKNQGCTCYLNSFLQSMFHLPAFRRIVYSFHTTGNEDPETSIPLNLQRLFCQMQFSDEPCSTKSLTKSFGWGDSEAFEQHDIHEFCCVLLENIEKKLKGTELENSIAELFKGRFRSFIRCRNVNYESSRVEDFYDLQMTVKGCPNLEKSFESYVETEEFVGENQYKTDDYGLQDADMGTEFIEFPKILQLHLRRFDFDYNTLQQIKINDKFEFPKEIDLSPYLAKDSKGKPSVFELFGVLVHSGSAFAGHYYSFLRTKLDDQWYEFDDSDVTKTTEEKAINDNFGGEYQSITRNVWKREKSYSAYILIYVRKDAEHEVYTEIPNETVPKHLKDFFERSKEEKEHRKKLREEMKNQIPIELIDEDSIKVNTSKYENGFEVEDNKQIIYVEKTTKISELYNIISEKRQIPNENLILWKCKYSGVPTSVLPRNSTKIVSTFGYSLTLFIDNIPNFKQLEDDEINIWAKFFFPGKSYPLQYIGQFRIKSTSIISEIYEQINTKIGYPKDTSLISYIETTTYPKLINHSLTFDDESISTGSILIFQQTLGDELLTPNIEFYVNTKEDDHKNKEEEEIKDKGEYSNVPIINTNDNINPQMLSVKQFLSSRSELLEILVSDIHNLDTPLFFLRFPSSSTFTDVKCFIAKNANIDYSPENDSIELYKEDSEHPNKPSLNAMGLNDDIVIEKISKENDCLFLLSKEEKKKKKKVVNGYGYRTKEKALKIDN